MKYLDILAAILLVIGGLNWGLWGLFELDLVATVGGAGTIVSKAIYVLVGLSAAYQAASVSAIQKRWKLEPASAVS